MTCTSKEQETCNVEKRGCKGCYYNKKLRVMLEKASDWGFNKIIEIDNLLELKDIYNEFVIAFPPFSELTIFPYTEKDKIDIKATIYDDYIE